MQSAILPRVLTCSFFFIELTPGVLARLASAMVQTPHAKNHFFFTFQAFRRLIYYITVDELVYCA